MSDPDIASDQLTSLFLAGTPLIDVRAPVEFAQGALPGAVNLPILNNDERAHIGTVYKQQGADAAVQLGYILVSGTVKQARLQHWLNFTEQHPQAVLYCFRGGKRSQIARQWLREAGTDRPLIIGGYKHVRRFLIDTIDNFSATRKLLVVTGPTGSGKTRLLHQLNHCYPVLDIEALACHRGSAFGALSVPQPAQADFENQLAVHLLKSVSFPTSKPVVVEDESHYTGKVYLPNRFFEHLRHSEIVWVDEPLESRVNNIFADYILDTPIGRSQHVRQTLTTSDGSTADRLYQQALAMFDRYADALQAISRKLGGERYQEILLELDFARSDFEQKNEIASNRIWIEKLVQYYYDPLYLGSLRRRQVHPVFKGTRQAVLEYLLARQH